MAKDFLPIHQRQVHLDFHTSPYISDAISEFDADDFAATLKAAHVNSVTVFAKCHHGQSYYPTSIGTRHPALGERDLLGEQIEALHREGIRAPIYTTVAWEEDVAERFPDWRQMRSDGTFAQLSNQGVPGGWRFNNFLDPDYQDYIEEHIRELLGRYDVDGFFFDIVFFDGSACWSDASLRFRKKLGLTEKNRSSQVRFETEAQVAFAARFTSLIQGIKSDCSIFYNSPNPIFTDSSEGIRRRHALQTHWELESLPSGFWGYHHFPRIARAFGAWDKSWLGMTGRFQRMWGDFGGLKPQAALEYECFRSQALGGANSIGDQLPPRGRLDAGAYDLIGAVYAQCVTAEAFYAGSRTHAEVAVVAPGAPELDQQLTDQSLEGAVQMCEEAHYECVVVDDSMPFDAYALVILPDYVRLTAALRDKLDHFVQSGGNLILSHLSGFNAEGLSEVPGVCLINRGDVETYPTYWRAIDRFSPSLAKSDRVVYLPGANIESGSETNTLVKRVLPYFQRTDLKFCSHFQTPPISTADRYPAVVQGGGYIYFADPIFREYRQYGNTAVRDGWKCAMNTLIGLPSFGHDLSSTILLIPRRRGSDLILTLLHYIPTRKAVAVDMIEERSSFSGDILRMPDRVTCVRDFESGEPLEKSDQGFILPSKKGRLLLEVFGYFTVER